MNILAWILFGLINGLIIHALDSKKQKGSRIAAMVLGGVGAVTGAVLAYLLFGRVQIVFNTTLFVVLVLECIMLMLLLAGRGFRKI